MFIYCLFFFFISYFFTFLVAHSEDLVHLVRNPQNDTDKKAIKVMTEDMMAQVGHIRAEDAQILSEALSLA